VEKVGSEEWGAERKKLIARCYGIFSPEIYDFDDISKNLYLEKISQEYLIFYPDS
jgi:hypothetical protein